MASPVASHFLGFGSLFSKVCHSYQRILTAHFPIKVSLLAFPVRDSESGVFCRCPFTHRVADRLPFYVCRFTIPLPLITRKMGFVSTNTKVIICSLTTNKKASRRGGCTNQIPLTIKPYPMPPSYGIIEYTSTFY
jgi:hypothetical protein